MDLPRRIRPKAVVPILFGWAFLIGALIPDVGKGEPPTSSYRIEVVKHDFKLYLYQGDRLIKAYPIAIGRNSGDKSREGDMRTPEGHFYINQIQDSRTWTHDFKDGKGRIAGAYGPWFLRLYTGADRTTSGKGWTGVAIHGTHDPNAIGTRASEGCIRMRNQDIEELKKMIEIPVSILP
jgi:lipoprotein-anchoring transpeptidase ErfK/SrfK